MPRICAFVKREPSTARSACSSRGSAGGGAAERAERVGEDHARALKERGKLLAGRLGDFQLQQKGGARGGAASAIRRSSSRVRSSSSPTVPAGGSLDLHAARADGGQQNACVLRAEKKGGVGRPLLHGFEQHILILFVQPRAVGEDVDLARALVRADEGVRPHAADDVHAQLGVLVVAHGEDVGMDVREHFAAVRAGQTGLVRAGTLQRGSGVMRRGVPGRPLPRG